MAESQTKIDAAAEKAYAEAAEKKTAEVNTKAVEKAVEADTTAPVKTAKVAKAVAAKPKKAPAKKKAAPTKAKKVAAKKAPAKKPVAKKAAPKKVAAKKAAPAKKAAKTSTTPITKLKETIMATAKNAKTTDYTAKAKEMAADMQTRAKAAYDKGAEMTQDAVEFQKGNLEALVESGKILAGGVQDMGRTYVEEAKSAAETVQADVKKMVAVKSPTELFQLQGEIARRNFDAMVSTTSKNTEAMLKLANEAFAPLSSRMSLAAEKVRKAA
ncbi:phasin family protein [Qipengyuania sp. 1NDW9]|uniref:Phasin family protein n=2 Tax=Qipengyuania TaxID=1855416 RepID=A0A9Q3S1U3_9SPHN|nr:MULTISPECIES: phasin family protein [Qipengyuania]MBX7492198.1 phasin family protein [Qipengyuania xiapuensis]MBY6127835.1 phasin family protein [Qipengyuania aquimaris]MBY6218629.1 phasin family protein [Qipengyuania aquimaris]QZD93563.1 phasin family protein [Qipengyuania xiapuensis]